MDPNAQARSMLSNALSLPDTIGFELLGTDLSKDAESGLKAALASGAVFQGGNDPLSIFRGTVQASIREIETDKRGRLFQRFLRDGPYESEGDIPAELRSQRLTDDETASVIAFIYSFMVNSFKGAVTELLAGAPCQRLVEQLRLSGVLPASTRLYVGDTVMVLRKTGKGVLKGADMHALVVHGQPTVAPSVTVAGVVEVKSGRKSADAMCRQLDQHILRTRHGVRVAGVTYPAAEVRLGCGPKTSILRITAQPSDWRLPRTFRFENTERGRLLCLDETVTPAEDDQVTNLGDDRWHIILKSSKEAIAQAAYEMTFWYMEKVGEIIYSDPDAMPKDWQEMTPAEAGRNAAKMMLYYAILRCRTPRENQRAIALSNTYGFGYALGMSFRNAEGRREMLWPQDLDEILQSGKTKHGCRIEKFYISRIESHPEW